MENIVRNLEDELTVSNNKINKLLEEYTKHDDIGKELINQKSIIINETLSLKSKCNFYKKEVEIRKTFHVRNNKEKEYQIGRKYQK